MTGAAIPAGPPDRPARGLIDALLAVSSDLDLDGVLDRVVRAACAVTGARYGALGVLGAGEDGLRRFVTHGVDEEQRAAIGPLPRGEGILGLLIRRPEPIRLPDLGEHPASVGFPPNHPPMVRFLGVPIRVRGKVFGNLYLCDKVDDTDFTEDDQRLVEALAAGAARVIENADAYVRSERRRIWLEAVARIGEVLHDTADPALVARQVAISARRLTGAEAAGVVRAAAGEVEVLAVDGPRAGPLAELARDLREQLAAAVGKEGELVRVRHGVGRVLMLPLREHFGEGGGLVLVGDHEPDAADVDLLRSFADQVALGLDRLHAGEQRDQMRLIADRERIARDLHDVVIQRLFATGLQLQAVRKMSGEAAVVARVDRAIEALDTTLRDIRGTIFDLRHAHEPTVRGAVQEVVEEYAETLGHMPRLTTAGPLETAVEEDLAEQLVTVLREALSNVARHAGARGTTVELVADAASVRLVVADDGRGLPAQRVESGLANLRARAEQRGGTVTLDSPAGGGTRVRWQVPLS